LGYPHKDDNYLHPRPRQGSEWPEVGKRIPSPDLSKALHKRVPCLRTPKRALVEQKLSGWRKLSLWTVNGRKTSYEARGFGMASAFMGGRVGRGKGGGGVLQIGRSIVPLSVVAVHVSL
jgi:hypothetical protein